MSKYTFADRRRAEASAGRPHPIWRGIGCLIILIVPVVSFAAAYLIAQIAIASRWPVPYELTGYPVVSPTLWKVAAFAPLWAFIQSQNNLYLILAFTVIIIFLLAILVSIIYAFVYRFTGPPRYGPYDEPPPSRKVKRYKR